MPKQKVTAKELREVFLDRIERHPQAKEMGPDWRSTAAIGFYHLDNLGAWELSGTLGGTLDDRILHSIALQVYPRIIAEYELVPG